MQLILHLKFLSKYEEYDDERSNGLLWQEYHQVCEGKEMPFAQQTSFCPRYDDFECNCVITTWLQMQNGRYKWFYTGTLIVIQVQVSWLFVICQTNDIEIVFLIGEHSVRRVKGLSEMTYGL